MTPYTYIYAVVLEFISGAKAEIELHFDLGSAQDMVDKFNGPTDVAKAATLIGVKRAYVAQRMVLGEIPATAKAPPQDDEGSSS